MFTDKKGKSRVTKKSSDEGGQMNDCHSAKGNNIFSNDKEISNI